MTLYIIAYNKITYSWATISSGYLRIKSENGKLKDLREKREFSGSNYEYIYFLYPLRHFSKLLKSALLRKILVSINFIIDWSIFYRFGSGFTWPESFTLVVFLLVMVSHLKFLHKSVSSHTTTSFTSPSSFTLSSSIYTDKLHL